jgi:hypothetical protein
MTTNSPAGLLLPGSVSSVPFSTLGSSRLKHRKSSHRIWGPFSSSSFLRTPPSPQSRQSPVSQPQHRPSLRGASRSGKPVETITFRVSPRIPSNAGTAGLSCLQVMPHLTILGLARQVARGLIPSSSMLKFAGSSLPRSHFTLYGLIALHKIRSRSA